MQQSHPLPTYTDTYMHTDIYTDTQEKAELNAGWQFFPQII